MFDHTQFTGKTVIVTGASQGIGLETAALFASYGAKVIMVARRLEHLEEARNKISPNENVFVFSCDISREREVDQLFKEIRGITGSVHYLVNNAGAFSEKAPWNEIPYETWIRAFETNTFGAVTCMRHAVEMMIANGIAGSIVNVGSSSAVQLKKGRVHYSASKSALMTISRVTALELAPYKIRVNVVSPGPTATEVVQKRMDARFPAEEERIRKIPLGRYASPRDIANAILFVSSEEASFITGAVIPVDGGYTIGETV